MFCSNCGTENKESAKFCEGCGVQLKFSEKDLRKEMLLKEEETKQKPEPKNVDKIDLDNARERFNDDPGKPVAGFEPKQDDGWDENEGWEKAENADDLNAATGADAANGMNNANTANGVNVATSANTANPGMPTQNTADGSAPQTPQKKGMGTCCLVSLAVGIVFLLLFIAFVFLLFIIGSSAHDEPVTSATVTPTATSAPVIWLTPEPTENPEVTEAPDATPTPVTNAVATAFGKDVVREPLITLKGNGEDRVTIMVYMNGSDLESDYGEATTDLREMVAAGSSDQVNIIVQTMGTEQWNDFDISSKRTQIHELTGSGLKTVKELSQLDCTEESTLSDFIVWTAQNYPADRYILLFWNHGGGPVYGFGYDQFNEDGILTTDEIQAALKKSGVIFDFIGMDCCIMSSLEVCCALYDYCDYMILSEDFESGLGWYYTNWLKKLYENTSISTPELAKTIIDDMILENEAKADGDEGILALIDQSKLKVLYAAWKNFAYANEDALLGNNYSRQVKARGKAHPRFGYFSDWLSEEYEEYTLSDYYISDLMAISQNIDSEESKALASAVNNTLIYVGRTLGDEELTGISVTLPYGDAYFYADLKDIFENCGFDSEYIEWLEKFVGGSNYESFYDYSDWDDEWYGWDYYEDDYNWYDWEYDDDDYWDDEYDWGWDDFDYYDSWNYWSDERDGWGDDYWYEDDWYWGDDYWYEDDWYWDDYGSDYWDWGWDW